jgi:hypothetical protein
MYANSYKKKQQRPPSKKKKQRGCIPPDISCLRYIILILVSLRAGKGGVVIELRYEAGGSEATRLARIRGWR